MGASASLKMGSLQMINAVRDFTIKAPDLAARKIPSAARRVTRFAKRTMPDATPPNPRPRFPGSPYPLRWTSQKQRRAFFATNGFGGGIPYRRSGKLMESWRVRTDLGAGVFILINTAPAARYVIGGDQQGFLRDIGWPNIETDRVPALDRVGEFASEQMTILHQSMIADYLEFVKR